jgi:WD40 repeat protein/serine/threonine protein kinase/Flp pilus assembly protein TadD
MTSDDATPPDPPTSAGPAGSNIPDTLPSQHPEGQPGANRQPTHLDDPHLTRGIPNWGGKGRRGGPRLPCRFGDYELLDEIARGGMGVVYRARQTRLDRVVALKMILSGCLASAEALERFRLEARAAANLDHPGIVQIHEIGEIDDQHFFSMALVDGGSLQEQVAEGPLPAVQAARLMHDITEAVQYAHERGIIHRDLKPANILLQKRQDARVPRPSQTQQPDGDPTTGSQDRATTPMASASAGSSTPPGPGATGYYPKITDFGLARTAESGLSVTGEVMGTPGYMPPEQARGDLSLIGPASDVYSLGAVLYCLLTGRPPFQAASPIETMRQALELEPVPPRQLNPGVPRDLETVCLRCLQKEPHRRYPSAHDLADELGRFLSGQPVLARPVGWFERAWRWCGRNRAVAALLATVVVVLVAGAAVSTLFAILATQREQEALQLAGDNDRLARETSTQRDNAIQARDLAERQRKRAEEGEQAIRRNLYVSYINRAHQAWRQGDVKRVLDLVEDPILAPAAEDLRNWEWHYLKRLCHADLFTLRGHRNQVWGVAYSPSGQYLVTGSHDRTLKLWDARTGAEIRTFHGHTDKVNGVAFSPDGKRIASASFDGTVRLWDPATGTLVQTLRAYSPVVISVAFSPDGKRVVGAGRTVTVWDTATGRELLTLAGYRSASFVAISPDGSRMATAGYDGTADLWDINTGRQTMHLAGNGKRLRCVAFSPDGKRLASAGDEGAVRLWDISAQNGTGKLLSLMLGHRDWVWGVAFSPDGRRLVSSSDDETVKVWDTARGREIVTFRGHTLGIATVVFSPSGWRIASASDDQTVKIWDARADQESLVVGEHSRPVRSIAFSRDGRRLASGSDDRTVKVWDPISGEERATLYGHTGPVFAVAFGRENTLVSAGGYNDEPGEIKVWDISTGQAQTLRGHRGTIYSLAVSPDGRLLVTGGFDRTVKFWDLATGQEQRTLADQAGPVSSIAFRPDGKWVAWSSGSAKDKRAGVITVWDRERQRPAWVLREEADQVRGIVFAPDGAYLAAATEKGGAVTTGKERGAIKLWNLTTGQRTRTLAGHTRLVSCLAISPDGRRLLSGSSDKTVRLWDTSTWQELMMLPSPYGIVEAVAISPDGKRLASAGYDQAVSVWDGEELSLEALALRRRPSLKTILSWHEREARTAEIDGQWFAALFHLRRLLEADPADPALLYFRRGRARAGLGEQEQAVSDFTRAIELKPREGAFWLGRHLAHARLGQWDMAEADYVKAATLSRIFDVPEGWWASRGSQARTTQVGYPPWTELAYDLLGIHTRRQEDGWLLRARGLALIAATRTEQIPAGSKLFRQFLEKAIQDFGQAADGKPEDWEAWRGQALACAEMSKWAEAEMAGFRALSLKNKDPGLWYLQGIVQKQLGRPAAAIEGFDLAIENGATGWGVWAERGFTQMRLAAWEKAVADFTRALDAGPADYLVWWDRGFAQGRLRRWDRARADYTEAIQREPREAGLWRSRGEANAELEAWKEAATDLKKALQLGPADPVVWNRLGLAQLGGGDTDGHRETCAQILERFRDAKQPDTVQPVVQLAILLPPAVKDMSLLLSLAERAQSQQPQHVLSLELLGGALYRAGRFAEARQRLLESAERQGHGGTIDTLLLLALVQHRLGQATEAKASLEAASTQIEKAASAAWHDRVRWRYLRREAEKLLAK